MCCLKAARAYTGRSRIAKAEGAYHGSYDFAEVSQTANPNNWGEEHRPTSVPVAHGTPDSVLNDVVVIPFNNTERALAILDEHRDELACILIDLMPHRIGLKPARPEFVQALQHWAHANGALLICDEVITLRSGYGGAQESYDISPDLTAMGKMIGGGFPVGALAGRAEIMDVMDPWADRVLFPHSGTFSANPVTMVAGLTAMQLFDRAAVEKLNALAVYARDTITEAIRIADVPACVTGAGSMFRVHMKAEVPDDYRGAFPDAAELARVNSLLEHLLEQGIIMINTCSAVLSTAMTQAEIDTLAESLLAGFRKL
jgi:glutamate-1-semialdehyde 2,1-aminomutase